MQSSPCCCFLLNFTFSQNFSLSTGAMLIADNGNVLLISSDSLSIPNSPSLPSLSLSPLSLIKVSSLTSDLKIRDWDELRWSRTVIHCFSLTGLGTSVKGHLSPGDWRVLATRQLHQTFDKISARPSLSILTEHGPLWPRTGKFLKKLNSCWDFDEKLWRVWKILLQMNQIRFDTAEN